MLIWLVESEISPKLFPPLLRLIFTTYPFYHDRYSRRAIERCIRAIFRAKCPPEALEEFVKAIYAESGKQGLAPSNAFVLIEWCSILLQEIPGTQYWERWGTKIIESNARVLELCISESSRSNVKHSALVITRRGLRKAFSGGDTRRKVIEDAVRLLASKAPQPSARNAVMLGVIAGVCARKPEAREVLSTQTPAYYDFYIREIIGSRTPVPGHLSNALDDFFSGFTTIEDVEKTIIPAVEKALLRAPEIVLNDLVTPLFHSLPASVDLSKVLRNNLLKPLLANTKSTNPAVRHGALSAFKAAVLRSHDEKMITQIAQEILSPLRAGIQAADQRAVYSEMLSALPISQDTATHVAPAIAVIAAKEANEAALTSETSTLIQYVTWGILNGLDIDKQVLDTFVKGVSDKKIPLRKLWVARLGEVFWVSDDSELVKTRLSKLAELTMPALIDIWQEVIGNPLAAVQSGLVAGAYVFTAISNARLSLCSSAKVETALKKAQVERQALTVDPKPSFLLNQRIYSKLTSEDDFRWFVRALSTVSRDLSSLEPNSTVAIAWSQAIMFCICSSGITPELHKIASRALSKMYLGSPALISSIITHGLWRWQHSIETAEKDSAPMAAKSDCQNLHTVVKSICLSAPELEMLHGKVDESTRKQQMISLLVLSRPELLPRVNWIELCLRVEVDPGTLAREFREVLLQQVLECTNFVESVSIPSIYAFELWS